MCRGTKLHQGDPISYLFITIDIAEVISERGTRVTRVEDGDGGRALCSISSSRRWVWASTNIRKRAMHLEDGHHVVELTVQATEEHDDHWLITDRVTKLGEGCGHAPEAAVVRSWWCSWSLDESCKIVSWGGARGTLTGQGTHPWDCTRHHEQRSVVASATVAGHWRQCRRFTSRWCSLSAPTPSVVFLEQHDIHANSLVGRWNTDRMVSKSLYPITHFWDHLVSFKKKVCTRIWMKFKILCCPSLGWYLRDCIPSVLHYSEFMTTGNHISTYILCWP